MYNLTEDEWNYKEKTVKGGTTPSKSIMTAVVQYHS